MPAAIYWDTSALIKLYAPESDSPRFRDLFRERTEPAAIGFLHRTEMYFALAGKERRGEIKPGGATLLFDSFQAHRREGRFLEIPWGEDVEGEARRALDACRRQDPSILLRSLAGLHLGAILAAGIQTVVSTDIRFRAAASCLGLAVV